MSFGEAEVEDRRRRDQLLKYFGGNRGKMREMESRE